jgi:N-acetylmuramoyl-L-alanine amidase
VKRVSVRAPAPAAAPAKQTRPAAERRFTVVIDPGHGGRDPGAVSRDGKVKEKDVSLGIARRMKQALEKQSDRAKVVLTRTGDTTMSLQSRTELANSLKADLFISIHCNSIDDTVSKGIETFYLSPTSCRKSMELAAKENGVSVSKMNEVQAVLLDLATTSKKTESDKLARIIQHSIISRLGGTQASSIDRGVRQAPFHVLLGARMPAVLVECAFISNPREKKKLQDPDYLNKLALGMAEGTIKYVTGAASMGSPVVTVRRDGPF